LRYDFEKNEPTNQIDTTGVVIARSGRGRDRGQHEIDQGQYDNQTDIIAVSGAAAMYRKSALEEVKYKRDDGRTEYFDEDFFMYWEDIDLSWRMINAGWKIKYNPKALAYHGRTAASSPKGYKRVWAFIQHHRKIPSQILKWNYKNHIFMFIKE
jgi:GT2 family glycosyltransferase